MVIDGLERAHVAEGLATASEANRASKLPAVPPPPPPAATPLLQTNRHVYGPFLESTANVPETAGASGLTAERIPSGVP